MRILLVEDDQELGPLLAMGLRHASYAVDLAPTCAIAREHLTLHHYDIACLDLGLPDGDGLDLLRSLEAGADPGADPGLGAGPGRGAGPQPDQQPDHAGIRPDRIIVLTARDAVTQRVAGLDAGADDYLVKPFSFDELLARIRAVSRRRDQIDANLVAGDLVLDTAARAVSRAGRPIDLTAREYALLHYLCRHQGQVVPAEQLLEHVWDANADPFTTSVRVLLSRLRRKLGQPPLIHTVVGAGYRLDPP